MRSSSIKYLFDQGIKNVWLNRSMTAASIGSLTACLIFIGVAFLISANINSLLGHLGEKLEIKAFIYDDRNDRDIEFVRSELELTHEVGSIVYVSKEEAHEKMTEIIGSDLHEGIPLIYPASFKIVARDWSELPVLVEKINSYEIFEKVEVPTDISETLVKIQMGMNLFGIGLVAALMIISVIVIANTIRATVFARRTEIGIMKQVGATNNFIRIPFMVEGIVIGVVSAVISFCITWLAYSQITRMLDGDLGDFISGLTGSILPFGSVAQDLALYFLGGGILTGIVSCILSLRKHLKV
ncbi:MAG: permease-like cell division protein FtsX [Oscillospiraceae bacterium]|nr:permease-like cell division protein FtsX [Oscillospiraceae bacterium]